jgi:hypothetical protein
MPDRSTIVRSLMPLVLFGFLIVVTALLCLLWPAASTNDNRGITVRHRERIGLTDETGTANLSRLFLDLSIYAIVIAGIAFMLTAWVGARRGMLVGLMGVGILGIAYASGMAQYTGPAVSICGFILLLFGGWVAWAASSPLPDESAETNGEPVDITANRTNDNASHSVA